MRITDIATVLRLLHGNRTWEVRAFEYDSNRIQSGYFTDRFICQKLVNQLERRTKCSGIYVTLNRIHPGLIARNPNQITKAGNTTSDKDVIASRWLLIDADPVRPANISSTEDDLCAAKDVQLAIIDWISSQWPHVTMLPACSGNGYHVLVHTPSAGLQDFVDQKDLLKTLDGLFSTKTVKIDTAVATPARITKLYGTWARKGRDTPERPHRQSYLECPRIGVNHHE